MFLLQHAKTHTSQLTNNMCSGRAAEHWRREYWIRQYEASQRPHACVGHIPGCPLPGCLGSLPLHHTPSGRFGEGPAPQDGVSLQPNASGQPQTLDSLIVNKCHIYLSPVRVYSTSKLYLYVCIQTCALTYFLNYLKPCFRHPYTSCLNSSACLTQVPVFPQAFSACPSNLILIQSH